MANPELVQFYEYVQGTSLIDAYFELDFFGKKAPKGPYYTKSGKMRSDKGFVSFYIKC